jgi:hypothetical protein
MFRSHIDHIVITAPSLAAGVEYVRQALGVTPQAGGEHPRNGDAQLCLLRILPGQITMRRRKSAICSSL